MRSSGLGIISAFSALRSLGFESKKILKAVEKFDGVKRRTEYIGNFNGTNFYDDYGHHPTEIKATTKRIKLDLKGILLVGY